MMCANNDSVTGTFGKIVGGRLACYDGLFAVILASHNLSPLFNDFKCGRAIIQLFSDLIALKGFFVPKSTLFIFFFNY